MTTDFEQLPIEERVRATLRRLCAADKRFYTAREVAAECSAKFTVARRSLDIATLRPGYSKRFLSSGVPTYIYEEEQ